VLDQRPVDPPAASPSAWPWWLAGIGCRALRPGKRLYGSVSYAEAKFTYNAKAGTAWYEFILPGGVRAEEGKLKASKEGKYSVPNIDPKTLLRETGFVEATLQKSYVDERKRVYRVISRGNYIRGNYVLP
jgi:hypothetical protein